MTFRLILLSKEKRFSGLALIDSIKRVFSVSLTSLVVSARKNFRIRDFCLAVKFEPYLETLPIFFPRTEKRSISGIKLFNIKPTFRQV